MSVLQHLSQPKSYAQQLTSRDVEPSYWWWGVGEAVGRENPEAGVAGWRSAELGLAPGNGSYRSAAAD
jgi:hypothetical protein